MVTSWARHGTGQLVGTFVPGALQAPGTEIKSLFSTYRRPLTAPNGEPWPTTAGYVRGYAYGNSDGRASVTIDNSQGVADVFLKLVEVNGAYGTPVRHAYIPHGQALQMSSVRTGRYELRYLNLATGANARSQTFDVTAARTPNGMEYQGYRITLYGSPRGNFHVSPISAREL